MLGLLVDSGQAARDLFFFPRILTLPYGFYTRGATTVFVSNLEMSWSKYTRGTSQDNKRHS